MISFSRTPKENRIVRQIAERALQGDRTGQRLDLEMDLIATHANGCPLDFAKLMAFDDFNFAHDINGIGRHLDRQTGKLLHCFVPRCARSCDATAALLKQMRRAA